MTADSDDDALRWGDEDPSHIAGPESAQHGRSAGRVSSGPDSGTTSSVLLVTFGVIAGVYLLYCVGWVLAVQRDTYTQASVFAEVMYQLGEFLAIASPLVWMAVVFALVKRSAGRLAWLLVGVVLLVPWPFVVGG